MNNGYTRHSICVRTSGTANLFVGLGRINDEGLMEYRQGLLYVYILLWQYSPSL